MVSPESLGKIRKLRARRILLQIPEGLKTRALEIAGNLEGKGLEVFISCEPCFGACDLRDREAKKLGCDAVLHIGHSDLGLKTSVPVVYEDYPLKYNPVPVLRKVSSMLKPCRSIALVSTIQYLDSLRKAKRFLESQGKKVFIGSPIKGKKGQVIGCDFSAATLLEKQVDCFLFIGSGMFHPIGLSMKVKKPVLFLNTDFGIISPVKKERDMLERIRLMQIEKAKDSRNFGILLSVKPGQLRLKTAERAAALLKKKGRNACMLIMDEITPDKILGMKLDCLVNCACPRLSEDFRQFKKPILDPGDVEKI